MQISFKLFGAFYDICIGRDTPWFSQVYLFSISRLWYDENNKVEMGEMIFTLFEEAPKNKA